jgi:hypothetical protein
MKKLIFLLILLPAVAFSQESLKKSAENFIISYFKLWEDKKWDVIVNSNSEDGQLIWPNHFVGSLPVSMKSLVERNKSEMTSDKIDVKWISADVMGATSAMVTASYLETTDRSGNVRVTDNLDVYLLELKDGSWKIKKLIPQDNYPLIYNENIDKKFQTGRLGPLPRYDGATGQMGAIMMYELEYFKKNGTNPAELGKLMGSRFAKTWDPSRGFAGLVSGCIWGLQTMSTYIEVLERNESTLKMKFIPFTISETWDITEKDMIDMFQNIWNEIANYMGGTCSLVDDGKYWIVTMNKK